MLDGCALEYFHAPERDEVLTLLFMGTAPLALVFVSRGIPEEVPWTPLMSPQL